MAARKSIITKDKQGNPIPVRKRKSRKKPFSELAPSTQARKKRKTASKRRATLNRRKYTKAQKEKRAAERVAKKGIDSLTLMNNLPEEQTLQTPGTLASAFKDFDREEIISCMELAKESDPRIEQMLLLYNELPLKERALQNVFDQLCAKVTLAPDKFFGHISAAAMRFNRGVSMMHLAKLEPEVIQAVGRRATGEENSRDGGTADAATFLKASGLIREGKGTTVAVQVNTSVNGKRKGLPAFEEEVVGAVNKVRAERERLLTAGEESDNNSVEGEIIDN